MFRIFALAIFMLAAAMSDGSARAAAPVTLRLGVIDNSVRNVPSLPLYIGQRHGFFTREGIDLRIVVLRGVEHQVEGLMDGTVDVSYTAVPYLIQAVMKGSDAIGVIGAPANQVFTLVAKPGIKNYADLKGKLVAMSLPQDTISIATRRLLQKHGLKEGDYKTVDLIGSGPRAECLSKGECYAAGLDQPRDIQLMRQGYIRLGDSLEVIPVLQFSVVAARRPWAETHKDVIVRFARAYADGYRFMRDPKNRDEVGKLMVEMTDAKPDMVREILALYYEPDRGVMPKQAEINMAGVDKVIDLLAQTGQIPKSGLPASRFIDLQYLKAAGLQ